MTEEIGKIIITLESTDKEYDYEPLGLSYDSTDQEIIDALSPVLEEEEGFNLAEECEDGNYTLKRADNSRRIFIFPKSVAGVL